MKGLYVDELQQILLSYHTTIETATRKTPFSLVYGIELMVPVEIDLSPTRRVEYNEEQNEEAINANLDLVEKSKRTPRLSSSYIKRKWKDNLILKHAEKIHRKLAIKEGFCLTQ